MVPPSRTHVTPDMQPLVDELDERRVAGDASQRERRSVPDASTQSDDSGRTGYGFGDVLAAGAITAAGVAGGVVGAEALATGGLAAGAAASYASVPLQDLGPGSSGQNPMETDLDDVELWNSTDTPYPVQPRTTQIRPEKIKEFESFLDNEVYYDTPEAGRAKDMLKSWMRDDAVLEDASREFTRRYGMQPTESELFTTLINRAVNHP